MAKHGRRRRKFRRYLKGRIEFELALATLSPKDLLGALVADVVTEETWCTSVKATWSLSDFTPGAQDGPIVCGIAHGDYSDAEIESYIELATSWDAGDEISKEIARRKVRIVGTFRVDEGAIGVAVLNDGRPITTKCGWMLGTGQTLRLWFYNSGSAVIVTGSFVHVTGHANLWPA